jgi:hypothetical protein
METKPPGPKLTDRARAEKQAREVREAAALRANLMRRKQQQRARQEESQQESSFSVEKEAKKLSSD